MSNQITILYVDDEDINLFLFERSFGSLYKVITANSGEAGLKKLEESSHDIIVVISDMRMPVMDGLEFVRRAKEKFKNIAYYVLTAFTHSDEIDKAIAEKLIDNFFTKPFDIAVIKAEVAKVAAVLKK